MTIQENEDVRYFRERYEQELVESGPEAAEKHRKCLEILKESIAIYYDTKTGDNECH